MRTLNQKRGGEVISTILVGPLIGFWIAAIVSANEKDNNNDRHEE